MHTLKFYKDEMGWFLDAPEYIENELGTKADLQMVSGADNLLDLLCVKTEKFVICPDIQHGTLEYQTRSYLTDEVSLEVHITPFVGATTLKRLPDEGWYVQLTDGHLLWLCGVTKWVFNGEYPEYIYYKKVES